MKAASCDRAAVPKAPPVTCCGVRNAGITRCPATKAAHEIEHLLRMLAMARLASISSCDARLWRDGGGRRIGGRRGNSCSYGCCFESRGSSNDERVLADWTVVAGVALVLLIGRLLLHLVVEAVCAEVLGIDLESKIAGRLRSVDQ